MSWLLLLLLTTFNALGQSQTLRGRVTDGKGSPLPGVTVLVKGTENGTSTDTEGRFQLNASQPQVTLVLSFIGFDTKEVAASAGTEVLVTLTESAKALSEVVVVGYGTQKKVNLTGAVSVVSGLGSGRRALRSAWTMPLRPPAKRSRQDANAPGSTASRRA